MFGFKQDKKFMRLVRSISKIAKKNDVNDVNTGMFIFLSHLVDQTNKSEDLSDGEKIEILELARVLCKSHLNNVEKSLSDIEKIEQIWKCTTTDQPHSYEKKF